MGSEVDSPSAVTEMPCLQLACEIIVYPYGIISDRSKMKTKLQIVNARLSKKAVTNRKTRSIDIHSFRQNVSFYGVLQSLSDALHVLTENFHSDLWEYFDKDAPHKQ